VKVSRYFSPVFLCSWVFDEELRILARATEDTERCLAEALHSVLELLIITNDIEE
jgi:hypothetical protein